MNQLAYVFRLPDIGEGIHEGEIVKWLVEEGQKINEDDILCEIQNDKSVVEIPSPVTGTVEKILVAEGTVSVVGDALIRSMHRVMSNLKVMKMTMTTAEDGSASTGDCGSRAIN